MELFALVPKPKMVADAVYMAIPPSHKSHLESEDNDFDCYISNLSKQTMCNYVLFNVVVPYTDTS